MKRLLISIVAIAAAVVLAAVFVPRDAATAGTSSVTRQALDADLAAIAGSPTYMCYLAEQTAITTGTTLPVLGAGRAHGSDGVYGTAFTDKWLSKMVDAGMEEQLAARKGLTLTSANLTVGRAILARQITDVLKAYARATGTSFPSCGGSGTAVLASMPASFVQQQVRIETTQSLLEAHAVGASLDKAGIAAYFDANRAKFDHVCLSVIVLKSKAAADAARAAIEGGTPFAEVAAHTSITTTTGSAGGTLGCGTLAGTRVFTGPLAGVGVNQVSQPIADQGNYLLVLVTSRTPATLSAVRARVVTVMLLAGSSPVRAELDAALRASHFTVDPRYGSARVKPTGIIAPPLNPPLSSVLAPGANAPGSSTGAG